MTAYYHISLAKTELNRAREVSSICSAVGCGSQLLTMMMVNGDAVGDSSWLATH